MYKPFAYKLFNQLQQQFGAINIVVNNARTGVGEPVADTNEADFDKVFGLNANAIALPLTGVKQ